MSPKSKKLFFLLCLFFSGLFSINAQVDITIEINWPAGSVNNHLTFQTVGGGTVIGTFCDTVNNTGACPVNSPNAGASYTDTQVFNVAYGTYELWLEDTRNNGWDGTNAYVRVYQQGLLIYADTLIDGDEKFATFTVAVIPDTDGDGIIDRYDYDDDNDGIDDAEELCETSSTLVTGSAEITISLDFDNWPGETSWVLRDPSNNIIATGSGFTGTPAIAVHNEVVNVSGDYTFTITDTKNGLANGSGSNSTSGYSVQLDGTYIYKSPDKINFTTVSHTIPVVVPIVLDYTCLTSDPSLDDDKDGIINYQDADYAAANGSSLNGSGVIALFDMDNDGLINSIDLDSDGDACFDTQEAGFTDGNNDGILGTITPETVDGDGYVTSGVDGYTTPADLDGNSTLDYLEVGAAPTISFQPVDVVESAGGTLTFSVTTSGADTYQWEVSTDGGGTFTDVPDNAIYDNVTTNTLTINNVLLTMDGYIYRVRISQSSFVCGLINSSNGLLSVNPRYAITNRKITYRVNK